MADVVALALPGGARWVDELKRAWDQGSAVAPVDLRLSPAARDEQMAALAPTIVVDETGRHRMDGGLPCDPGDALVVATSGTSAAPRAAVLTHEALMAAARATSTALEVDPARDRWLACLPLAHVGGLGVVTRALLTDTPLEVHDGFDADAVRTSARTGANLVSLVPAVLGRIEPEAFRRILLGGSAIPADRPANSVATYGMTETGGGVVYDGYPLDGVELRTVDGEVQLRCPMLMRSYRDGHDPRLPGGWYPTGDAGTIEDGRLTIAGRVSDPIVTGGEKVWPARVEALLAGHPGIGSVAIVGRPDPTWGETVTAVVERAPDVDPPSLEALQDIVREHLPPWCVPRALEVVDHLPRTGLGKIRRSAV